MKNKTLTSNGRKHMSHFSYACKTEGENGISRLISALCVNCMSVVPEYSRIFVTVLRDGEINNIIILQHLSMMIPFLKCPFIPTFLLIKARRCHSLGSFFVIFFPHACPHFKSDICKDNRRSHVKLHNILFYFNN